MKSLCAFLLTLLTTLTVSVACAQAARTEETQALLNWLSSVSLAPALGAQWNGGLNSVGWVEQHEITARYPLLYGIEYADHGPIEKKATDRTRASWHAKEAFKNGGIVTLVDHMPNFVTGGDSWDRKGDVLRATAVGGMARVEYLAYLDRLAAFISTLQVDGIAVPVIIRPFHEMNGNWFWWGHSKEPHGFVEAWRDYHRYLTQTKGLNNLIWAWSPNIERGMTMERLQSYWPGDDVVDVIGADGYFNTADGIADIEQRLIAPYQAVSRFAVLKEKPFAITELGANPAAQTSVVFWTEGIKRLLGALERPSAYMLVWNAAWGPRVGTAGADGFRELTSQGRVLLLGDVKRTDLYGPRLNR